MSYRPGASASYRSVLMFGLVVLVLSACASRSTPPAVTDRTSSAREPESEYREVVAGDTLYSIAWESGRDFRELAAWNHIPPPYTIRPGQKIRLHPPQTTVTHDSRTHIVRRGETLFSIASRYDLTVSDLAAWNGIGAPFTIRPGQQLRLTGPTRQTAATPSDRQTPRSVDKSPTTLPSARGKPARSVAGAWTWPTEGNLLTRFNNAGSRGIDIAGKAGQTIVAAAPGTVVYQGSGLRGYGQLIIVKHDSDFLSAYAHCDKIVVREGNVIKRGQKIAEMGSSGTDRVKLHFEIRYRGTPVDPLDHLPKR